MTQTLDQLIAELRKQIKISESYDDEYCLRNSEVLSLLDALEAMRAQRDEMANDLAGSSASGYKAYLDAEIARVLRGKP